MIEKEPQLASQKELDEKDLKRQQTKKLASEPTKSEDVMAIDEKVEVMKKEDEK